MTIEELYNSYEFKLIKRAIIKEYPWVIDMTVKQEDLNKYPSIIFITVTMNGPKFWEETGTEPAGWIKYYLTRKESFSRDCMMNLAFYVSDEFKEQIKTLQKEMNKFVNRIMTSDMIPSELKIPKTDKGRTYGMELYLWDIIL